YEQIQYASFRARGYPIGSGIIESANKLLMEARLKGAGMHWLPASVDPLLALRSAGQSGRWETTWPLVAAQRCFAHRTDRAARRQARVAARATPPAHEHPRSSPRRRRWRDFRLPGSPTPRRANL